MKLFPVFLAIVAWVSLFPFRASAHPDLPEKYDYAKTYKTTVDRVRALRLVQQVADLKQDDPNRPVGEDSSFVGTSDFGRCGGPANIHVEYTFGDLAPLRYGVEQNDRHPGFHTLLGKDFEISNEIRIQGDNIINQHSNEQPQNLPLANLRKIPNSGFYFEILNKYRNAVEGILLTSTNPNRHSEALQELKALKAACDARDPALRPGLKTASVPVTSDVPEGVRGKLQMACYFGLSELFDETPGPWGRIDRPSPALHVLMQAVLPGASIPPGLYVYHQAESSSFVPFPKLADSALSKCGAKFLYVVKLKGESSPTLVEVDYSTKPATVRPTPSEAGLEAYDTKRSCVLNADASELARTDASTKAILEAKATGMLSALERVKVSDIPVGARINVANRVASCLGTKTGLFEDPQERAHWTALWQSLEHSLTSIPLSTPEPKKAGVSK